MLLQSSKSSLPRLQHTIWPNKDFLNEYETGKKLTHVFVESHVFAVDSFFCSSLPEEQLYSLCVILVIKKSLALLESLVLRMADLSVESPA